MTEYYELSPTHSVDARNAARAGDHPHGFRYLMRDAGFIADVPELSWTWVAPFPFPDWVLTNDTIRVFSPRMADVVRAHLGPRDRVQWLHGTVITPDGQAHSHEVPHFPEHPDIYDMEATTWGPSGLPIRWVLARHKLDGLHFFARERSAGPVIAHHSLVDALQRAGITGITAKPARITPLGWASDPTA